MKKVHTGYYRVKDIEFKDESLKIINEDIFQQVQELLEERTRIGLNAFGKSHELDDSVIVGVN